MAKGNKKTDDVLLESLIDKMSGLKQLVREITLLSCIDKMREFKSQVISVVLRDLLIDSGSQTSLLSQLDMKRLMYFDVKFVPLSGPYNMATESKLTKYVLINRQLFFESTSFDGQHYYIDCVNWMNEIIIDTKDENNNFVSRREVILAVADTLGAHTDRFFEKKYDLICNFNALKFYAEFDGIKYNPTNNPYYEIIITIAQEIIEAYDFCRANRNYSVENRNLNPQIYSMRAQYFDTNNPTLYRFFVWMKGTNEGAVFLNRVHFDIHPATVVSSSMGDIKFVNFMDSTRKVKKNLLFFDFQNPVDLIPIVSEDKSVFTVIAKDSQKYTLLSG